MCDYYVILLLFNFLVSLKICVLFLHRSIFVWYLILFFFYFICIMIEKFSFTIFQLKISKHLTLICSLWFKYISSFLSSLSLPTFPCHIHSFHSVSFSYYILLFLLLRKNKQMFFLFFILINRFLILSISQNICTLYCYIQKFIITFSA